MTKQKQQIHIFLILLCVTVTSILTPAAMGQTKSALLDEFLAGPMAGVDEIVFACRQLNYDGHWYANFGYYADNSERKAYRAMGRLCKLNIRKGEMAVLLDVPQGTIRDPQVHYDGRTIIFSYRKADSEHYHLYEIDSDGTNLKQLTDGQYDDIEPTYLPDGSIIFCSSRCKRWVNCLLTHVAVLHRCDANGKNIRPISANNEQENTPWPLPDGQVLYQRWEYVDRSQVHYHHLWTTNPDEKASAQPVSKEDDYHDPYPFSEVCFLVAQGQKLLLMNGQGKTSEIYWLPAELARADVQCHEPRPLLPRARERAIPSRIDLQQRTGRLVLSDVYKGRHMKGVKRGEIKKLLVLETLPMAISDNRNVPPWDAQPGYVPRHLIFNLTRPEKSLILLAPLSRMSGGYGLCKSNSTDEGTAIFADTDDPGYQAILDLCIAGKKQLDKIKRFDMPDFRPRPAYVREMKKYGIIPENLAADARIDPYAIDRAYWQSLWYNPEVTINWKQ